MIPPTSETPLVGRGDDLSALLSAIRSGGGRAVVVAGPAGVGKTRLVREATVRMDRSGRRYLALTGTRAASGPSALVLWQLSTEGRIDVLATVRVPAGA